MLDHPWSEPPALGQACEVAEGVLWTRLPLPFPGLDHVNIYALDDGEAWTLLDTGLDWAKSRAALAAFQKALGRPVARVVITHHHPDHIGMAGTLARQGVEVLISRVAYLSARMLSFDVQERPTPEMVRFRNRAGMTGAALAAYAEERPFNLADGVAALPLGFTRLSEGDTLHAGGRDWRVRLGEGHAPEMVTLWSEDGALMLAGDQVLPGISPNIGVSATEPGADPLSGWIETCTRFRALGGDPLVLPGHRLPFCGLHTRLTHLIDNHTRALEHIEAHLHKTPSTAVGLFPTLYRREIGASEYGLALVEAVAHLNHLHAKGRVRRDLDDEGAWVYALREAPL